MSSPQVFPVNHSARPENAKEQTTAVISGRRLSALYAKYSPLTWLAKTLLVCYPWTAGVYSSRYALRWKVKATPFNRLLFQLAASERRTAGTGCGLSLLKTHTANLMEGCKPKGTPGSTGTLAQQFAHGLLPTPRRQMANGAGKHGTGGPDLQTVVSLLPTPQANVDGRGAKPDWTWHGTYWRKPNGKKVQSNVRHCLEMLPTPTAADEKKIRNLDTKGRQHDLKKRHLPAVLAEHGRNNGLKLQPAFAEWMMGFPEGWTELDD